MKRVTLTTDGACIGNPGPGGWACVLRFESRLGEMFGSEAETTNNRMELKAVIEGLKALKERCDVTINTDSQYVQKGITEWLSRWKSTGWKRKKPDSNGDWSIRNQDLWSELDALTIEHTLHWKWVRGHATHLDNIRCDFLANRAAREQLSSNGMIRLPLQSSGHT